MKQNQNEHLSQEAIRIHHLVKQLNQYRHEYYNMNAPSVSDAVYDCLFDELDALEKRTGIILSNSPTQTVGYQAVSQLDKVHHPIPLLSLDKTKQITEIHDFMKKQKSLLMLKLDGLTIKLTYENGRLIEASTRGDGDEGEIVTHNASAFRNIPLSIPYQKRLVISGEAFIHIHDFERLQNTLLDSNGNPYRNARNLAAGSARCLDANICKERSVSFYAFHVLEGLDESSELSKSREARLTALHPLGFDICPFLVLSSEASLETLNEAMATLRDLASELDIPIDGLVLRYDDLPYSVACGRTGRFYKDGKAFKFEDDTFKTIFRSIEWQTGRTGEIAPVALFDPIEIDGSTVSRASLHNLTFIQDLELYPGCRILVSNRNMIIPHIEENLDRGHYQDMTPRTCPCCGSPTRIYSRSSGSERIVQTLHCDNPNCSQQILQRFVHFCEKKAMNIIGISEATLKQFIDLGFLKCFQDIYHLDRFSDQIADMDGFGKKSYERLWNSINESRNTTFVRYLVAMDIPMIGRTASRKLEQYFHGNLLELELAAMSRFDFTCLEDFGETMSSNIIEWFHDRENLTLWRNLQKEMHFKEREETIMTETKNNPFAGCTIVATGKLENFTRDSINSKIISLGATAGSSVTKKTDYLICGEKAGSKLAKAQQLGVKVLSEQEFLNMIA